MQAEEYERTHVAVILDDDTGRVVSVSPGPSAQEACRFALETALMVPADPFEPGPPLHVRCATQHLDVVTPELGTLLHGAAPTPEPVNPAPHYEDRFDSLIGKFCGRPQPAFQDAPAAGDWQLLHDIAARYRQVEPWKRWSVAGQLSLTIKIDGVSARYLTIVIGDNDTQRGLMMYPGGAVPTLHDQDEQTPPPDGTLLFYLDDTDEVITEYRDRASRYGWPQDADTMPVLVTGGPGGPGDLDRRAARHMTIALNAVLRYDGDTTATAATGHVELSDGVRAEFTITTAR
jgi:hypothetical protein